MIRVEQPSGYHLATGVDFGFGKWLNGKEIGSPHWTISATG
jgi:hypothetical protein